MGRGHLRRPSVLGENGLLHGRKYTCYPGFENDEKYHGTYTAAPLQQDGKIITANGAGNAMTFALYLLAALQGRKKRWKWAVLSR